jgi:2-dehydro-3-deoxygalactonokinase
MVINCAVFIDAGTTNTRVWLADNNQVLARATAAVGVRDTARDGSPARLHNALRDLIADVCAEAASRDTNCIPSCVVAAGMITSSLGLVEVPHLPAPAGLAELSAAIHTCRFPEITRLPILLIPGVRTGPNRCTLETVGSADMIRGEESLCMGLLASGRLNAGSKLLNLGSHWKVISLDDRSRIVSSVTSLSGELIHATQTQTILASALPSERPTLLDKEWLDAGMRQQRQSGLTRTLFCVRSLEQRCDGGPEERYAYLIGAFLSAELDDLRTSGVLADDIRVTISGAGVLAEAWRYALEQISMPAFVLSEEEIEEGLLTGLQSIAATFSSRERKSAISCPDNHPA